MFGLWSFRIKYKENTRDKPDSFSCAPTLKFGTPPGPGYPGPRAPNDNLTMPPALSSCHTLRSRFTHRQAAASVTAALAEVRGSPERKREESAARAINALTYQLSLKAGPEFALRYKEAMMGDYTRTAVEGLRYWLEHERVRRQSF